MEKQDYLVKQIECENKIKAALNEFLNGTDLSPDQINVELSTIDYQVSKSMVIAVSLIVTDNSKRWTSSTY